MHTLIYAKYCMTARTYMYKSSQRGEEGWGLVAD